MIISIMETPWKGQTGKNIDSEENIVLKDLGVIINENLELRNHIEKKITLPGEMYSSDRKGPLESNKDGTWS